MTKHTPGPWEWDGYTLRPVAPETDITSVMTAETFSMMYRDGNLEAVTAEEAQNKLLIAAAPDLLDAAKAAADVLKKQKWRTDSTDPEAVALAKLLAAIARAEEPQ